MAQLFIGRPVLAWVIAILISLGGILAIPGLPISHSPPALVVGPGVEGVIPSPLTAEEFDTVSVGGE